MAEPNTMPNADPGQTGDEDPIAKLRAELAQARAALAAKDGQIASAERFARASEQRAMSEGEQRLLAQEVAVDNALAAKQNEKEALRKEITSLQQDGKYDQATDAIEKLADAVAAIRELTGHKQQISGERARVANAAAQAETVGADIDGQIHANLQQLGQSQRDFVKRHLDANGRPRFYTDKSFNQRVISIHHVALADGLDEGSPEYYEFIEGRLAGGPRRTADVRDDEPGGELDYTVKNPQPRGSMASAPTTRAIPGGADPAQSRNVVARLTKEQREAADDAMSHIADPTERYAMYAKGIDYWKNRGSTGTRH